MWIFGNTLYITFSQVIQHITPDRTFCMSVSLHSLFQVHNLSNKYSEIRMMMELGRRQWGEWTYFTLFKCCVASELFYPMNETWRQNKCISVFSSTGLCVLILAQPYSILAQQHTDGKIPWRVWNHMTETWWSFSLPGWTHRAKQHHHASHPPHHHAFYK